MTMRFNPAAWQRLLASGTAAPLEPLYVDDGDGHPDRWVSPRIVFTPPAEMDENRWVRAFNRLDAAITHHQRATSNVLGDHEDADAALYKARDKVLRDLSA